MKIPVSVKSLLLTVGGVVIGMIIYDKLVSPHFDTVVKQ